MIPLQFCLHKESLKYVNATFLTSGSQGLHSSWRILFDTLDFVPQEDGLKNTRKEKPLPKQTELWLCSPERVEVHVVVFFFLKECTLWSAPEIWVNLLKFPLHRVCQTVWNLALSKPWMVRALSCPVLQGLPSVWSQSLNKSAKTAYQTVRSGNKPGKYFTTSCLPTTIGFFFFPPLRSWVSMLGWI